MVRTISDFAKNGGMMKIGLALSGGGALSMSHVGIIRALEKNKISLSCISGTSSGAIIAALYADGGLERVEEYIVTMAESGIFKRNNINLLMPDKIFAETRRSLEKVLKAKTFEELRMPLICAATNFATGKPEFIASGNLVDAVMASAAYLALFSIQHVNNKFLVDGGITRSLPATPLKKIGADFIIGSSLYSISKISEEEIKKYGRIKIGLRAIAIMQKELAAFEESSCDFCFVPPINRFKWYNLDRILEINKIGEEYARRKMPQLKKILADKSS